VPIYRGKGLIFGSFFRLLGFSSFHLQNTREQFSPKRIYLCSFEEGESCKRTASMISALKPGLVRCVYFPWSIDAATISASLSSLKISGFELRTAVELVLTANAMHTDKANAIASVGTARIQTCGATYQWQTDENPLNPLILKFK
jgi:hypothetical protein